MIQGLCYPAAERKKLRVIGELIPEHVGLMTDPIPSLRAIAEAKRDFSVLTVQASFRVGLGVVVSQCCDCQVRRENGRDVYPRLVVAPMHPVQGRIRSDDMESLKANSLTDFLDIYYLAASPPRLQEDYYVDLGAMVALSSDWYPSVLHGKILQMADKERVNLKLKIGHYFARPTDEEQAQDIYRAVAVTSISDDEA